MPLQLAALTPIALIGYRNELQHEQRKSISTINLRVSALRAWCAWLMDQGYLPLDPAARVKLVSGAVGSKRDGLSSSQVNALLRQAQASRAPARNYAIVQVLVQTGIRLSECSGLTFGDITFGERSGLLLIRAGKGNKVRSVPLTTSAMGQVIAELVEAVGELVPEETSAHHLRHTFACSYLAQYPGDLVGLATLLGHLSFDTTRLYSEPSVSQLASRVERLALNAYSG